MDRPRCTLCGGTAGRLAPEGYHYLCRARADRGLPILRLGDACPACNGNGRIPRSAVGPTNPSQAAIDRWAPPCARCAGTGVEPGTREDPLLPGIEKPAG